MNTEIGNDYCEVDQPFQILENLSPSGVNCEIFPEGFLNRVFFSIEDFDNQSDSSWKLTTRAIPIIKDEKSSTGFICDFKNQQEVIFNSSSYWSECGKFKRKQFER